MRLDREFIRLPLTVDAVRLAREVAQFEEADWRPHPEGHSGNWALPLVSAGGDPANDGVKGAMRPTPHLARCPYVQEVLQSLCAPIGRTRLMRIDGNAEATPHVDMNYYWMQRARVHVPVVTDPAVRFICGDKELHMAAGEAWIFDTSKTHNVINPNPTRRIHLVIDTKGSPEFWAMVAGEAPSSAFGTRSTRGARSGQALPPAGGGEGSRLELQFESHNYPVVMSPDEQASLVPLLDGALHSEIDRFLDDWRQVWHEHGEARSGWPRYRALLEELDRRLGASGEGRAVMIARHMFVYAALNPELADLQPAEAPHIALRRFDRPVFIVSSPRAGSSLLFETLARAPGVFSPGGESHAIIEGIEPLHPAAKNWDSNRLTAADATPEVVARLERRFLDSLRDRKGDMRLPDRVRMLEKTPKNSLRIPFLHAAFPDALFIYLYRDPRATISSMLDAWRSGRFVTYPNLWGGGLHAAGSPEDRRPEGLRSTQKWSLLLVPGWRDVIDQPLNEIVAHQWETATRMMLDDLEALPADSWCVASYDRLVGEPQKEIERLCTFVGFGWDTPLTAPLPLSKHTLTPPGIQKLERNGPEIDAVYDRIRSTAERAREVFAREPLQRVRVVPAPPPPVEPKNEISFRSIHTSSFPEILSSLGASLLVSTYQSGRVVVVRADGGVLNTHLVAAPSPMGMAVGAGMLSIGTARQVVTYRNAGALAPKLGTAAKHDACFSPRAMHITGDIRVHEIAYDSAGELWLVNTRFSTLCTLDATHSFVPRWRPSFITALAAEDRCHLNGLAMIDGRPRFVTALGISDQRDGWREKKAGGGVLMEIDSGSVVLSGLSMPHSPRWYAGRMWILESGKGTLSTIDLPHGKMDVVTELPGFTRGLAFAGPYAFVGLSQVRESVFEGIPLAQRLAPSDRACGVWVVDVRSGNIVAFLKFEGSVQEIFDVQVLHGIRYPELLEPDSDAVATLYTVPEGARAVPAAGVV